MIDFTIAAMGAQTIIMIVQAAILLHHTKLLKGK